MIGPGHTGGRTLAGFEPRYARTHVLCLRTSAEATPTLRHSPSYSAPHHKLLTCMDGQSVSVEAAAAIATLEVDVRPEIQSDHGSGFIAREFAETLSETGVTHTKIRPHTPTDNAEIERYHRTIGERIDEEELEDVTQAKAVIGRIIDSYNNVRLHSALSFLRPVDYYRGNPEALLAERRRNLQAARELRKQENIKLRQRLIPWTEDRTVSYSEPAIVSL